MYVAEWGLGKVVWRRLGLSESWGARRCGGAINMWKAEEGNVQVPSLSDLGFPTCLVGKLFTGLC